jgi:DNA invertase Pin-like site-specific DNA recombinase
METCNARRSSPKRAVAYYRRSAQDRPEESVEKQQARVRKFAQDNGIQIVQEFADHGKATIAMDTRRGV